jgi:trimethylamine--corrinoid protein Co-methyltransferase
MLDYVLTFSLEKLVFDDELCGQALHFVRESAAMEDLPTLNLARELLAEKHLLIAEHTLKYWPQELYLPGPTFDRTNREQWAREGGKDLRQRTREEVEKRLAAYMPVETDSAAHAELIRLIKTGLTTEAPLPEAPLPLARPATAETRGRRERRRVRERG